MRLEIWVDESKPDLVDRVQKALEFLPQTGMGQLEAIAITGSGDYRDFVATAHPDFVKGLMAKLSSYEGLWINQYPPGIEDRIKAGTIWKTEAEADRPA